MIKSLRFQIYSYPDPEFQDFQAGHLDVVDWETSASSWPSYDSNPDFLQTPAQGQYGDLGMYFNGASSRFTHIPGTPTSGADATPFWGCDWNNGGIPFTNTMQTYTSLCGKDMRAALAHLVDRQAFTDPRVLAHLVCPSPTAKNPSCEPDSTCGFKSKSCITIAQECTWDDPSIVTRVAGVAPGACLDAFRYGHNGSVNGDQAVGSVDFCIAAEYMVAAGVATGLTGPTDDQGRIIPTPSGCILTGVNPNIVSHPLRTMVRSSQPRYDMGLAFDKALNELFGQSVTQQRFRFNPLIVFSDNCFSIACYTVGGNIDDWDMYTYGYGLGGPYPDHLFGLYNGSKASNYCGGLQNGYPFNNQFVCNPPLDTDTSAAHRGLDVPTFTNATLAAFNDWGRAVIDIPVFSSIIRTVALRSVSGLVNEMGAGYPNTWTLLNAHQDPSYTPVNPIYSFGGGDPSTLRWGMASGTNTLDIFNAQTIWEFTVLSAVYDTLFASSPVEPGKSFCWMCTTYRTFVDSRGNEHFIVELKQNLRWHDGVPVDAYDVKFSLLNLRDNSSCGACGDMSNLLSVNILDSRDLEIVWLGSSITYPFDMEQFIIPRHLWELSRDRSYGDVGVVDPMKLAYNYDPIVAGTFIGSGPFVCVSGTLTNPGTIGKGCAPSQQLNPGDSLVLTAFDFTGAAGNTDPFLQYHRSYNSAWGTTTTGSGTTTPFSGEYQEFSWADQNNDDQVTIADVASVSACFGASTPTNACTNALYNYWLRSAFHPNSPNTIGIEVAIVASHLDDTWIYPFSWSGDQTIQPGQTLDSIVPFSP